MCKFLFDIHLQEDSMASCKFSIHRDMFVITNLIQHEPFLLVDALDNWIIRCKASFYLTFSLEILDFR